MPLVADEKPRRYELARILWGLPAIVCWFAGANVVLLVLVGSYDVSWLGLRLQAHQLFKPILILNAAFWGGILWSPARASRVEPGSERCSARRVFAIAFGIFAAVFILYWGSVQINVQDHDWNHSHISAGLHSLGDVGRLFTTPQADGFYRPLTFLSLWVDFLIFGKSLWGYHLQSIALHASNALLVWTVATYLRVSVLAATCAALLFACAAINFEAVLWPAARFDLLATGFALVSIIFFLRYVDRPGKQILQLASSVGAFTLAILNKESAYCAPLIGLALVLIWPDWNAQRIPKMKLRLALLAFATVTVLMISIRVAIYHNLGGYPPTVSPTGSPHFAFTFKTITSLFTRVLVIPLLGLNTTVPLSPLVKILVTAFSAGLAVLITRGIRSPEYGRAALSLAILAALPTLNLVGWIGPSMQHARYLYLPGIWLFLGASVITARSRLVTAVFLLILSANAAGVLHNLSVYRETINRAGLLASRIRADSTRTGAATADVVNLPASLDGVFFFSSELIAQARPAVEVREISAPNGEAKCRPGQSAANLLYYWDSARETLDGPRQCRN